MTESRTNLDLPTSLLSTPLSKATSEESNPSASIQREAKTAKTAFPSLGTGRLSLRGCEVVSGRAQGLLSTPWRMIGEGITSRDNIEWDRNEPVPLRARAIALAQEMLPLLSTIPREPLSDRARQSF
jgi:hypothetical protein